MNNLIVSQNQTLTMSSREIAELTGKQVGHVHRDFKEMAKELGFASQGALMPTPNLDLGFSYEFDAQKRIYAINLNQELTMTMVSGYSVKLRNAIIKRWQELESKQAPQLPQSFAEALQLAADQAKQLELAAPKVEFHDKIVNDEKTFSFRDAAKKIQQRPNKFIEWLRDNGYLCLNNIAKQQYITQGLFATHTGVSDVGHHYTQCRVTSKGLSYFTSKLGDEKL